MRLKKQFGDFLARLDKKTVIRLTDEINEVPDL
jgi:hypothetical protein